MIRANNPAIDVDALMERVGAEAARLRATGAVEARRAEPRDHSDHSIDRALEAHPSVSLSISIAERLNVARSDVPKRLRGVAGAPARFMLRVFNYAFKQQRELDRHQNDALSGLALMAAETATHAQRTEYAQAEAIAQLSAQLTARIDEIAQRLTVVDALAARSAATPIGSEIQLNIVDAVREVERRLADVQDRTLRADALLRSELAALRRSGPAASAGAADAPNGAQAAMPDALYEAIEDRFRGSSAHVRTLLTEHLARVRASSVVSPALPLLDLGCGRGEWLELLGEYGVPAFGVDSNEVAVGEAGMRGVDARPGDLLATLREAEPASLGAITAFHVVEHLPYGAVAELLSQVMRTLAPRGMLILETPNPANILVATRQFWLDPTHLRPVPSELLAFTVEAAGFGAVEVVALHPPDVPAFEEGSALAPLNAYFSAPQDYAVVAIRPA